MCECIMRKKALNTKADNLQRDLCEAKEAFAQTQKTKSQAHHKYCKQTDEVTANEVQSTPKTYIYTHSHKRGFSPCITVVGGGG